MIEQFYYTWSPIGLEKNTGGVQIRAASPGLSDPINARVRALKSICVYALPKGVLAHSARPADSPVCLTWMTVGKDRVLAHKVFAGFDANTRAGNYFVHLLAGLPAEWTAKDAINYWRSSFWQWNADQLTANQLELPSISSPDRILAGRLTDADLRDPSVQKYMAMVIQAYLSLKADERLFIAAPSDQVATLIWGLTRALPNFLLRDLTFSTYEREPENAKDLKVIGTYWEGAYDLPAACYQGYGIGINCDTGKHSPVLDSKTGFAWEYAQFAADKLQSDFRRITAFVDTLNTANVYNENGFRVCFDLERRPPHKLLKLDELNHVIQNTGLAKLYLQREGVQESLISSALDSQWWNTIGKGAIDRLRHVAATNDDLRVGFDKLEKKTLGRIRAMLVQDAQSNAGVCATLLQGLAARVVSDGKPETAFEKLVESFNADLGAQPWQYKHLDIREWILQQWKWIEPKGNWASAALERWLDVAWQDLSDFLRLAIDPEHKLRAVKKCIQRSLDSAQRPTNVVRIVEANFEMFKEALKALVREPQSRGIAQTFFGELVRQGYTRKIELLNELLNADPSNSLFVDQLLNLARLQTGQEVQKLIGLRGVRFLYERWTSTVGQRLLETGLLGLDHEAQKSGSYRAKMQAVNKLLDVEPGDADFTEFILGKANLKTVDEILQLSEDWRIKVLYNCWQDVAKRQLLETYLQQTAFVGANVLRKLLAVPQADEQFKDFVLDKANLTFQNIQSLLDTYGPQLLYSRWDRPVGKKMLDTYLIGLKKDSFKSKMESVNQLLAAAPNEEAKDVVLEKVELRDKREIETLIENQDDQFLDSVTRHPVRSQLLATYLRSLDWVTVKQPSTDRLLRRMWTRVAEINLPSLKHYLVLYLDVPGLDALIKDLANLFGEMREVPLEDKENIRRKLQEIAPKLKPHGQRLVQLVEEFESRQAMFQEDIKPVAPTPSPVTMQPSPTATGSPQTPPATISTNWWQNLQSSKVAWIGGIIVVVCILCLCITLVPVYCTRNTCSLPFVPAQTEMSPSPTLLPPGRITKTQPEAFTQSRIQGTPSVTPTCTPALTPMPLSTPTPSQTWTPTSRQTPSAIPTRSPQIRQLVSSSDPTNNWSDQKVVYHNPCPTSGTCWNLSTILAGKPLVKELYISEYNQVFPKLESYEVEMAWLVFGSQPEPNETHGYGVTFTTVDGAKWILQIATKENAVHFAFFEYSNNIPDSLPWVPCDCGTANLSNPHKFLVKYQKDGNATISINGKPLGYSTGTVPRQGSNALKVGLVVFGKSSRAQISSAQVTIEP